VVKVFVLFVPFVVESIEEIDTVIEVRLNGPMVKEHRVFVN